MQYPAYKYVLIFLVMSVALLYALPNLYQDEPAVQITSSSAGTALSPTIVADASKILIDAGIKSHGASVNGNTALLRVDTSEAQLKAQEVLRQKLSSDHVVALNLAQTTPTWLTKIGAKPMKLGLDLRGGVRFVLEVDLAKVSEQRLNALTQELRSTLKDGNAIADAMQVKNNTIELLYADSQKRDTAQRLLANMGAAYTVSPRTDGLVLALSDSGLSDLNKQAITQNLVTIRNRINELGVAEALVQSQGNNRIVVELPGVQDTAEAKRVLGRTANLEFRMVSENAMMGDIAPAGTEVFPFETLDGAPVLLERSPIVTGERVQNAQAGVDEHAMPEVSITLDSAGGRLMQNATRAAVGKQMAVLFIENKQKIQYSTDANGKTVETRTPISEARVINRATIQAVLGSSFRITGLDNAAEASELALLLRAGALAAPMYFVEERTIGPSLGQENIDKGIFSTQVGYALVFLFMLIFYRLFGLFANIALAFNVIIMVAVMSVIGSALTLPGIAGIVLTIGMAVDANVLIFERIREELATGVSAKSAIIAGFDRAFSSIFDANITTLLVAFILFAIGTGPIKGFAVTLAIGILSSLFTAIVVTRAITHLVYGKQSKKLSI